MKAFIEEIKANWTLCKRAVASGAADAPCTLTKEVPRVKHIIKSKEYDGKWDTIVIDNFLWHMERYFPTLSLEDKVQVNTGFIYFIDIAMVWWHKKCAEIEKSTFTIDS